MSKLIILISLTILIFCSCEPSGVAKGRTAYKEYFDKTLKDPSSLVIHSEEVITQDESSATFVLDIGAKNSYGGMVRQTYTIRTIGKGILDVTEYDIRALPKNPPKDMQKSNFVYKNKMIPIVGFDPKNYIGKEITLSDSCVYANLFYDIPKSIEAAKNSDKNKIKYLGGILPSGSKIKIISERDGTFEIESELCIGVTYYIEQSSIF